MIPKLLGCALALAVAHAIPAFAKGESELSAVKAATERFKDVKIALAEGYIPAPGNMCETSSMMGRAGPDMGMGIHYFRPDLLGITEAPNPRVNGNGTYTDFLKPAILIYEPQGDGSLVLVAVENLVFKKAWHAAGHKEPPSFMGVPYDPMADDPATPADEAHNFEPHYDRHVWVHRKNPIGVFAQFNPEVSCGAHNSQMASATHSHH